MTGRWRTVSIGGVESVNFDRAAAFYDASRSLPSAAMDELTELLAGELRGRQPCLEVGVGTGRFALPLRARGITLAGADISGAMLRRLAANAGGRAPLPLLQADATRMPAAPRSFGSVLAVHVLHLIPEWRVALDEVVRVVRPGGMLLASFPADHGSAGAARADAPWSAAMRAATRGHGLVRQPVGARDPRAVEDYLGSRAAARQLAPVTFDTETTLGEEIENLERQLFSWTWPYPPEQALAAGGEVRGWAQRAGLPLSTAYQSQRTSRWWAFDIG